MNRADDRRPNATSAYPRVLGRYHLLEELSENGIGVLHLARLEGPNGFQRWAAVRRVHPHLAQDPSFVRDFFEAARGAASIRHPNVEATLDVGDTEGTLWAALEYLHGERVAHLVSRAEIAETGVAWDVSCRIVGQAALGLDAIHVSHGSRGEPLELMHGPMTPRQIFVSYEGETKVLEACVPRRGSSTMSSDVLPYMAPEQVLEEPFDRRADIFALGVVLWELCAGRRLFLGDDDDQTRALIERHHVPRLETKVRGLPARVDEIIALALAVDPRHRYQTAQDMALAIDEALVAEQLVVTDYDAGRYMKALFADRFAAREDRLHRAADATEIFSRAKLASSIPPPRRPSIPPPQAPPKKRAQSIPEAPNTIRDVHETPTVEGLSMDHYLVDSNENPTSIMTDEERKLLVAEANPTKATTDENETAIHRGARQPSLEFLDSTEIAQVDHRTVHLDIDPDEEEEAPEQFYRTGETNIGPTPEPAGLPMPAMVRHASEEMRAVPAMRPPSPSMEEYNARMDHVPTVEINATPPPMSAVDAARMGHHPGILHIAPSSHPPGMYPAQMMPPQPPIPMAAQTFMIQPKPTNELQTVVWLFVFALAVGCAALAYERLGRTNSSNPQSVDTVPPATAVVPATSSSTGASGGSINPRDLPTSTGVIPSQARPPRGGSHTSGPRGGHPATTHTSAPPSAPDPGGGSSSGAGSGFLTVICTPACDDVLDGSSSLGPSPVFKAQVKSGTHHITLKTSDPPVTKSISVTVPVDDTTVVKQAMGE